MRTLLLALAVAMSTPTLTAEQRASCYSSKGTVFNVSFGSTKSVLLSAVLKLGLDETAITCARSETNGSDETCDVNVESAAWQRVRPYPVLGDEHFAFAFKDGLFVGTLHLLEFVKAGDAVDTYYKAKEVFAAAYGKPGKNPGFWRRQGAKFGSRLIGTKFVNAANWEDASHASAVVFLQRRPNSFVLLVHAQKGFE